MPRIAVIDVGSNAIRYGVAEFQSNGTYKLLHSGREAVRLGTDVFSDSSIAPATIENAVAAFRRIKAIFDSSAVLQIKALGTSALREATNAQVLIDRVAAECSIKLEVIDGLEEARLIHLAVSHELDLKKKLAVVVDIGGGSTEVSLVHNDNIIVSESHKIGAVRLLHILEVQKRSLKLIARLVNDYIKSLKHHIKREIGSRKVDCCVGTGGNFEALGLLRVSFLGRKDKKRISLSELERIYKRLESLTVEERINELNLRPDRADVILPATAIIIQIMKASDVRELLIPHVGLRDGIVLDMLPFVLGTPRALQRRAIIAYTYELGRKYSFDNEHATTVAMHAVRLFDKTLKLHKLDKDHRILLEVAALLHEIGQFISLHDYHKHTFYLLKSTAFIGLDTRQQQIITCVARYHRKATPKADHEIFGLMQKPDQDIVIRLSALLRIADALDSNQIGTPGKLRIQLKQDNSRETLSIRSTDSPWLECFAVEKRSALFEDVFKVKVEASNCEPGRSF